MSHAYVDPYAVLGLTPAATTGEIKKAYFTLVRAHPPERDPATFKQVRAAYERLRDPEQRAETDMLLLRAWQPPARKRRQQKPDVKLHTEDVITAMRAMTDLDRIDWREQHEKVRV